MNKWLVKMRSLFRVVKPGISISLRGRKLFQAARSFCAGVLWSRPGAGGPAPVPAKRRLIRPELAAPRLFDKGFEPSPFRGFAGGGSKKLQKI
jgi:hypothetical protein